MSDAGRERPSIAIRGIGVATPLGLDARSTWSAVQRGSSGVHTIELFDAAALGVRIAGEAPLPNARYFSKTMKREARDRKEDLAMRVFDEAMASAGIEPSDLAESPFGIFCGSEKAVSEDLSIYEQYERSPLGLGDPELALVHQLSIDRRSADAFCRELLVALPPPTFYANYAQACAASAVAVVQAVRWLRRGLLKRAIVVGVDTPVNSASVIDFHLLGALSTRNEAPQEASRPFDARRDGFVLSEGAGALILEAVRGHTAYSVIRGIGMNNNQDHITKTPVLGSRCAAAMTAALVDAGVTPAEIDYINAHGTSTDVGDVGETNGIRNVFAMPPPVSSTKSMTGHLIAAAGIVELCLTQLAGQHGFLPPTTNQQEPDPDCGLDYVANSGRAAPIRYAMSNSFGFGGTNVAILVGPGSGGAP